MSNSKWAALGVALLASTALTGAASAAEWSASIGGSGKVGIGYVDGQDADFLVGEEAADAGQIDSDSVSLVNDSQIVFDFKLVADNGITFGYRFDLDTGVNNLDEHNAYVSGSFGKFELGTEDGASDKLNITPPGCSFSCPGDGGGFLFDYNTEVSAVGIDADGDDSGDDLKISYFTPNFQGFTAGVSYVPEAGQGEGINSTTLLNSSEDAWEFGAQYRGDITEDFDLGVSVVYFMTDDDGLGDNLAIAAEVGIMDATSVGGRWIDDEGATGCDAFGNNCTDSDDRQVLSLGIEHGMGPWGFFLNWAQNLDADNPEIDGSWGLSGEVDYSLAPGVKTGLTLEYGAPEATDSDDEFAIGTWMSLSF